MGFLQKGQSRSTPTLGGSLCRDYRFPVQLHSQKRHQGAASAHIDHFTAFPWAPGRHWEGRH